MMTNLPEWWNKTDITSLARKLRLATVKNIFEQRMCSKEEAKELLAAPLEPDNQDTFYDDSQWLN